MSLTGAQKLPSALKFYEGKVEELGANLKDLETIVQRKQQNSRSVEEGMSSPNSTILPVVSCSLMSI